MSGMILCVLRYSYGEIFWHLNSTQLDLSGDGFKNYYTFAYQLAYGSGFHFNGMLYPYGDLMQYADAQPFWVFCFQFLGKMGMDVEGYALGIINILPILSLLLGAFLVYLILKKYEVSWLLAIIISVFCMVLSPQIFRMQSHYALSYAYVLPGIWLMLMNLEESKLWLKVFLIIAYILVHGFIHPYLMMAMLLFVTARWLVKLVMNRRIDWAILIVMIVVPLLFFGIMGSLDEIDDRPKNPYGLLRYKTEVSDVLPFFGVIEEYFGDLLRLRDEHNEGYCYPGVLILLFPIFYILIGIGQLFKKGRKIGSIQLPTSLFQYFISGILLLLFAMGLHILLTGGLILEVIGPLKQFRGLGRMSWPFYYVCFLFLAVLADRWIKVIQKPILRSSIWLVIICLWTYEAYCYQSFFAGAVQTYKSADLLNTETTIRDLLQEKNIDATDFQAMLTLPSSSEGMEKWSAMDDWFVKITSLPYSYQTGLPVTACILSRASISRVANILQMTSSSYVPKSIQKDLHSILPFLVVIPNNYESMYSDVLNQGKLIGKSEYISLYRLPMSYLNYQDKISQDSLNSMINLEELVSGQLLFFNDFEDESKAEGLKSSGALLITTGAETLVDIPLELDSTSIIGISFWYKLQEDDSNVPHFIFRTMVEDGSERQHIDYRDWSMKRVEIIDNWVRIYQKFTLQPQDQRLTFEALGQHIVLDRFLLKTEELQVYKISDDRRYVQFNHFLAELKK